MGGSLAVEFLETDMKRTGWAQLLFRPGFSSSLGPCMTNSLMSFIFIFLINFFASSRRTFSSPPLGRALLRHSYKRGNQSRRDVHISGVYRCFFFSLPFADRPMLTGSRLGHGMKHPCVFLSLVLSLCFFCTCSVSPIHYGRAW